MIPCSRDTILHIADKEELFRKFLYTLKPGGKLMISDYCHGDKVAHFKHPKYDPIYGQVHSQQFKDYVAQRGYKLETVKGYGDVLKKAGFKDVSTTKVKTTFVTARCPRWLPLTKLASWSRCSIRS